MIPIQPVAQQLSLALSEIIAKKIAQNGSLSFSGYMQLALYHPTLGYYNNGGQKFGEGGDFVTAPEISPLFGQCIAAHIAPVLAELNNADVLEFGAGSGQLAVDVLQELDAVNQLPSHYYILELSAELQERQRQKIIGQMPKMEGRVIWLTHLPENFQGVVLANEVLDAMPVDRFCFHDEAFWECMVDCDAGVLKEKLVSPNPRLIEALSQYGLELSDGYHSEINLHIPGWLSSLATCMTRGLVLLIDYGFPRREYYHPDRSMGTLMCHYQHYAQTDPYWMPGLQDITAHVDFTTVAESAVSAGFELAGYTTQAHFLLDCGLMELSANQQGTVRENWGMSQAIKKLVLPSEMGELCKVMALTKALATPVRGFGLKDMRGKL